MVRVPSCRPNPLRHADQEAFLLEKKALLDQFSSPRTSPMPKQLPTYRPSLEDKQLVWATFACRQFEDLPCSNGAEIPPGTNSEPKCPSEGLEIQCPGLAESGCAGQPLPNEIVEIEQASPKTAPVSPTPPITPKVRQAVSPKETKLMSPCLEKSSLSAQDLPGVNPENCLPSTKTPAPPTVPRGSRTPRSFRRTMRSRTV